MKIFMFTEISTDVKIYESLWVHNIKSFKEDTTLAGREEGLEEIESRAGYTYSDIKLRLESFHRHQRSTEHRCSEADSAIYEMDCKYQDYAIWK